MAIFGNQGATLVLEYLHSGQVCQNVFQYSALEESDYEDSNTFGNAWASDVGTELADILGDAVLLIGASVTMTATDLNPIVPVPAFIPMGVNGAVAGETLPPYVSARLVKAPDNATLEPPTSQDFRNGMLRIGGVPESFQDAGFITPTALAIYQTFCTAVISVTAGSSAFNMIMGRNGPTTEHPDLPPAGVCFVDSLTASSMLGSQNTRKR